MKNTRYIRLVVALALSTVFMAGCHRDQVATQPDGTKTITKADGTQVVIHPDGSQTVTKPDGTQVAISPTGGVTTQAANGAQTSVSPNGGVGTTAGNGAQTSVQPNGAVTAAAANGAQTSTQPNGAVTAPAPNGAQVSTQAGGAATASPYANGGVATTANAANQPGASGQGQAVANGPDQEDAQPTNGPALLVPAGTALNIRLNQRISVKTSHRGDRFTGTVVNPVTVNGGIAIPDGSRVRGVVTEAHRRGHFKGRSVLQLRLTSLDIANGGGHYALDSSRVTRGKKGKGKRSFGLIGGGTGLGMLVGGIASGGVGLVVGGLVGAGGGTAAAGLTGNRDIDYPAESVITFRLADAIDIR